MHLNDLSSKLLPVFSEPKTAFNYAPYTDAIRNALEKNLFERMALSECFAGIDSPDSACLREACLSCLPLVTATKCQELPGTMSFFAITLKQANVFKFFFEMIDDWLLPGKRLNVVLVYSADFQLPEFGDDTYVLSEVMVRIEDEKELEQILVNLRAIEPEIQMGLSSGYYARRILEIKRFSTNEKTAACQEDIVQKHLLHPIFMPRNEEEVIRNILSLSSQIKYVRDIPQVFISFDEQTHSYVFFTIVLVRVLKPDSLSIQEMFKKNGSFLEYIHDRCQAVGSLRKRYKKEATVFRVKLPKDQFLRADHTIDINKARQTIVSELFNVIGDIRDFNGGMITKQNEVLSDLKKLLKGSLKYNELLLENFFYSLTPVIMQNVLEIEALHTLFLMLLDAIEDGCFNKKNYALKVFAAKQFVFVMIKADDRSVKDELNKAIAELQLHSSQLAASHVSFYEEIYFGYIYRSDDPEGQQRFSYTIQHALTCWESQKH